MKQGRSISTLVAVCTALIGLGAGRVAADGPKAAGPKVVIELFTSQGCSSCPAADKLLGELAKDSSILPMSLSVDYWDYLGWKDTLALPGHAKRQRAYAGNRGDRAVYTPQAVINGATHVLGSDKQAIARAVKQAHSHEPLAVKASIADGKLQIDIPAAKQPGQSGEIWLCPLSKQVPVKIGRGENGGQNVTYTNVVRGWIKLGDWKGNELRLSKPLSEISAKGKFDAFAILVQAGKSDAPGVVYGATTASLN